MIDENPWNLKLSTKVRSEGLNPKDFSSVMSAIKHIDSKFFGKSIGPMRSLAGDECIHPFFGGFLQLSTCAASHHPDPSANVLAARNDPRLNAHGFGQSRGQFRARDFCCRFETYELSMIEEERPQSLKSQTRAQLCIVPQGWMNIE